MVTAMSIAGDLSFNPETDTLTGANGEAYMYMYMYMRFMRNNLWHNLCKN